jgi:hypothetical protein
VFKGLQKRNRSNESSGGSGGSSGKGTVFVVRKNGCEVGDFWAFLCLFVFYCSPPLSSLSFL